MGQLILLRHGQSIWNQENKFTGWADVDLSEQGRREAAKAGEQLKSIQIDQVFCSDLKRALHTAQLVLKAAGQEQCPISQDAALNERHYGDLQGLDKAAMAEKYGVEQIQLWRRSYDIRPPGGESLKDTYERVLPYYERVIKPVLQAHRTVLIVAHGNSLRALIKELDHKSDAEIVSLEIPTGVPIFYGEPS